MRDVHDRSARSKYLFDGCALRLRQVDCSVARRQSGHQVHALRPPLHDTPVLNPRYIAVGCIVQAGESSRLRCQCWNLCGIRVYICLHPRNRRGGLCVGDPPHKLRSKPVPAESGTTEGTENLRLRANRRRDTVRSVCSQNHAAKSAMRQVEHLLRPKQLNLSPC